MNRNTQSGAIGTFVVVGVVLVLAALAVLYGVRQFTISQRVSPVPTDIALPSDNNSTEVAENSQQSQQDKKQQEDKIVYVDKEIEVIKWRTETRLKTIKEYIRDENLTDCQNALNFARAAF